MFVPPLRPSNNIEPYISGDVTIHPTVVIATGVILQAAPNSRIIIGPGVCIGMGTILQVDEGILEVEAGANLGAGFLMVGKGKIGANTCIGSATTVFRCSVAAGQVVAPGSILGDTSRRISEQLSGTDDNQEFDDVWAATKVTQESEVFEVANTTQQSEVFEEANITQESEGFEVTNTTQESEPSVTEIEEPPQPQPTTTSLATSAETSAPVEPPAEPAHNGNNFGAHIYGQGNVKRLLSTLFPYNQTLRQPLNDGQSE
jgi:carbon dioxide concentrating mechanism protein CcmN